MLRWRKLEVSGGFLLLTAFLYYLGEGSLLFWTFIVGGVHELGHYAAIRLLGGEVVRLRLTCTGAELRLSGRKSLSGGRELAVTLAGPLFNLVFAQIFARLAPLLGEIGHLLTGLNLSLALFNLLPAAQLDGGRALRRLFGLLRREWLGECVTRLLSVGVGGVLLCWSAVLLCRGRFNLTLLAVGLWMLVPAMPERRRISR